ncbi:probable ribonuclease ZC3H12C isoform X2 [Drosophila subpulchrella]|uniref:probable ribonuclease ZC3H12C isoform X2 n=1 Tax=Drosophila subpulchrella TaxID=1486046 RepID=UPI0018A1A904|nr:probable ribonuclease ZC3H12C isoform X2 [Drosophila subpulchrella]
MVKPRSKEDRKKARKAKQHWHKRGLASTKASKILLQLAAEDPERDADPGPSTTVVTLETAVSSSSSEMPRTVGQNGFRKISAKKLKRKAMQKKKFDREMLSKILGSIKKKYNVQKNPQIRRRLDFRSKESPTKNRVLPKPKFYRPQKATAISTENLNDTIEDGEVVEDLVSSDDDDCVLLETPNVSINIEDDDEPCTSDKLLKDVVKDCNGEAALRIKPKTENPVLYSTVLKTDLSESIINLDEVSEEVASSVVDNNDSVIFIEDTIGTEDFIPIPSYSPPLRNGKKKRRSARLAESPKRKTARMSDSLFTTAEKKKLGDYNRNTFNPSEEAGEVSDKPKTNKRSIIIDGSNVAFAHGNSNVFSSEGIKFCLQYFEKIGHDVKAVIPMFRRNIYKSSNPELLDKLHKEGKIVFTPCKNLHGQMSSCYDDRFILQLAYEKNAAVVSNDNYRDLIDENPAFKKIVENRVLGYSWCDDIFILPKDPYGRWGPTLDEILRC